MNSDQSASTLFARWEDVERQVFNAVEGVLTDHDPAEGPLHPSQIEWAQEMAALVVSATMLHLDGYQPCDLVALDQSHARTED